MVQECIEKNTSISRLKDTNENLGTDLRLKLSIISDLKTEQEKERRSLRAREETERLLLVEKKLHQDSQRDLIQVQQDLTESNNEFARYRSTTLDNTQQILDNENRIKTLEQQNAALEIDLL